MPIEDVDYLRKNSIKQSYIFLVDSKDRNKNSYRTPSEYVVEFTQPFENVIGFEVLDASIPRTMYNVDAYNNQIRFFIYSSNYNWDAYTSQIPWKTVSIEPGDYTIQTLVPAINSQLTMHLNNDTTLPMVSIYATPVSNPPDIKNTLMFYCPYPFLFDMNASSSSMAETIGFDMPVSSAERELYDLFNKASILTTPLKTSIYQQLPSKDDYQILESIPTATKSLIMTLRDVYTNQHFYKSVDKQFQLSDTTTYGQSTTLFEGPRSVIRNYKITANAYIAQHFTVSAQQYLTSIKIAFTSDSTTNVDTSAQYAIYTGTLTNPIVSLNNRKAYGNIGITAIDGSYSTAEIQQVCFLEPGIDYWLVVYNDDNQDLSVYFNNVANKGNDSMVVTSITPNESNNPWSLLDEPDIPFQMSCALLGNYEHHEIVSPGIYNLVGEKYIVLRCKEIEENSYRSLAYTRHNLGLAKFRLGVVGYSDTRMDFSKVPLREFHPIGRLVKITLRFETANGELYDFKGVNHNITFAIHYLEPMQKMNFEQSILNPNYNGNFIDYRFKEDDQEGDSDDQEEDFSRDVVGNYKKYETMYLPENLRIQNMPVVYQHPKFDSDEEYESEDDF